MTDLEVRHAELVDLLDRLVLIDPIPDSAWTVADEIRELDALLREQNDG